jgi:hypothetical protein
MKTKTFFKSALVVLLLGVNVSAMAEYVKDPTLCMGMTVTWDATARTFTVKNLKPNIQEPFCAWVTDPMWTKGTYVELSSGKGITPGATTYETLSLDPKWGDPLARGTNGSSYLSVAIKSVNNDNPIGTIKAEDCAKTFISDGPNAISSLSVDIAPVSVFPNPAAVGQAVNVKGTFDADSRVAIYDGTASLIATVVPTITSDGLTFEVPAQATAINFIKIISSKGIFSAKLSVVK